MNGFYEPDEPLIKIIRAFEEGEKGTTMAFPSPERPTVLVPREPSETCPDPLCAKKSYRRVIFSDSRTGWFCYACAHTVMVPGMKP